MLLGNSEKDENEIPEKEGERISEGKPRDDVNISISRPAHYNTFHMFQNAEKAWELYGKAWEM